MNTRSQMDDSIYAIESLVPIGVRSDIFRDDSFNCAGQRHQRHALRSPANAPPARRIRYPASIGTRLALTNIYRHAKATHASIVLSSVASPPEIRLRIQDDGIGIDPAKPAGLGLTGMRERVRGLGGRLSFGVAPGGGGLIDVALPSSAQDSAK